MVVFTCGNCGEAVKKPGVPKHLGRCRAPANLSCVDCFKDFRGTEYEAHVKCLTEEERYSAKGFVSKPNSNKGEKKQQSWFEAVQNVLNSDRKLSNDERELLTILSNHVNLPRKKGKFINFINNAHRAYARRYELVERVWNIVEEVGKSATAVPETPKKEPGEEVTNGNVENSTEETKKKRKGSETEAEDVTPAKKKKNKNKDNVVEEAELEENGTTANGTDYKAELEKIVTMTDLNLHKLNKAVRKCVASLSPEESAKVLKKLEKRITISSVTLRD